jgi:hypothetical protein
LPRCCRWHELRYLYILEKCPDAYGAPPDFLAHAPEFARAPYYAPVTGSGDTPDEALSRLEHHLKAELVEILERGDSIPTPQYGTVDEYVAKECVTDDVTEFLLSSGHVVVSVHTKCCPAGGPSLPENTQICAF